MKTPPLLALLPCLLSAPAWAGSTSAPGTIGGPESGAATPNVAAAHYNPAALAATDGVQTMVDVQMAFIRIDATATRNDGIDPNTGEPYSVAQARVQVPAAIIGASWKVLPDRLALGFAVSDPLVGGGDYTAGEPDLEPPYESHQRYAGVQTTLLTIHMIGAAGLTVIDGVHVGGSFKYIYDSFSAIQASDPLHQEGLGADGPYTGDTLLTVDTTGSHTGWSAGLFVDKIPQAQVGASFTRNGVFSTEGTGSVSVPDAFGGGTPDAIATFEGPLPDVVQAWVRSEIDEKLTVGAGVEYQMWGACCSGPEGDYVIGVVSEDGDPLGADPEDGIAIEVAETQYAARRLQNSANFAVNGDYQLNEKVWLGGRLGFNQSAVPDQVVSATNIDYQSFGGMLAGRYALGPMELGLSYSKFFLQTREITNSAWDAAEDDPNYIDERFSPSLPFKANTNGTYEGAVDIVGLRIGGAF